MRPEQRAAAPRRVVIFPVANAAARGFPAADPGRRSCSVARFGSGLLARARPGAHDRDAPATTRSQFGPALIHMCVAATHFC